VEVKIGIRDVAREVVLESEETAQAVAAAVEAALAAGTVLQLLDDRGRRIVVPAAMIGYVEIGAQDSRRVGFGTL
jgi:hypothetical protein